MKRSAIFFTIILVFTALFAGCGESSPGTPDYTALAQCLSSKGVKFYGSFTCPHCLKQKKAFGDAAKYLPYVECHPDGPGADLEACNKAGIDRYPTWIIPGFPPFIGEVPLEEIAKKSNCSDTLPTAVLSTQSTLK